VICVCVYVCVCVCVCVCADVLGRACHFVISFSFVGPHTNWSDCGSEPADCLHHNHVLITP